jgi:hypothetical protein
MSSDIWTRCADDSEIGPLALVAWRLVEAQHVVSTRKLVESAAEQELLEELIERAKPPRRDDGRLHYLLATPFRYPPLPHGSRFGQRMERGLWYGSEDQRTACAEVAYYRLVFLEGSAAAPGPLRTSLTAFTVRFGVRTGCDLTSGCFAAHDATIASRTSYTETQALGTALRDAGVQAIRYPSARDTGGVNVCVFTPAAFGRAEPRELHVFHCTATREAVEFVTRGGRRRQTITFPREHFMVGRRLPAPAI